MLRVNFFILFLLLNINILALSPQVSGFYTTIGIGKSHLKPIIKGDNLEIIRGKDDSYKIGLGYKINDKFEMEIGYSDLGYAKVRNNVSNTSIDIDYKQLTAGIIYRPGIYKEVSPFITFGARKTFSDFNKIDELSHYLGIGGDIKLDDDDYMDLRFSYLKYSDDAKTFFIETIQHW